MTLAVSVDAWSQTDHIAFEDLGRRVGDFEVTGGASPRSLSVLFKLGRQPLGQHAGTLRFHLCRDANCTTEVTTTPFALPYLINVAAPPPPQITPTSLSLTVEATDRASADFEVTITGLQAYSGAVLGAMDPQSRFDTQVQPLTSASENNPTFRARVRTLPILVPGTYTGTLNLFLCLNLSCPDPVPGSQVAVPYTIVVTPATTLQPVPTTSGLPEWETFQGTASHSGYVPATLDPARFTDRWTWNPPADTYWMNPVATGSGKAVVSWRNSFATETALFAINEADGTIAWRRDLSQSVSVYPLEPPSVWGGRVFMYLAVADPIRGRAKAMHAFDLRDGALLFRTDVVSQGEEYLAPTIADGIVYAGGGEYGGLNAFRGNTGTLRWFKALAQCKDWTPAVDANYVYAHSNNTLSVLDRATGVPYKTIQDIEPSCASPGVAPVLPGDGSVVQVAGGFNTTHLRRYDVAEGKATWSVRGPFAGNPVVAKGVVYVVNAGTSKLEARSLATGEIQWTWNLPEAVGRAPNNSPTGNLLLTDNLVFVVTSAKTYAVNLDTHAAVWSTARTGSLSLSSKLVLYIATTGYVSSQAPSKGRIDAIDLAGGP